MASGRKTARKPATHRGSGKHQIQNDIHPAGPHARPELTDDEATPGTGALPDNRKSGEVDPAVG